MTSGESGSELVAVLGGIGAAHPAEPVEILAEADLLPGGPVVPLRADGERKGHAEAEDDNEDQAAPLAAREGVDLGGRQGKVVLVRGLKMGDSRLDARRVGPELGRRVE